MRLSDKTKINKNLGNPPINSADFDKSEFDGLLKFKGYDVIHEKAYLCPCKSKESAHRNTCKNCGGVGLFFANPTKTRMIITGIMSDDKLKQGALENWGMLDSGSVKITSYDSDKLGFMDRISILDATAEINDILYPSLTDDETQLFAYTKYDIKGIDFIGLFQTETTKIKRLIEVTDYTYVDNIITFDDQYNNLTDPCVTIRYKYNPVFHVTDIVRESMTSPALNATQKLILPVHAIAKRAHLIKDVENFNGDRLLDNSWKPSECEAEELTKFQRQLRYATAQEIYDILTDTQKSQLLDLLN